MRTNFKMEREKLKLTQKELAENLIYQKYI